MRIIRSKPLVLVAALALAGCASTPRLGGDPGLKVMTAAELPAPVPADLAADTRPYYVGPLDKLEIDVFGIPELSKREVQVDSDGNISFPMAGTLAVGGKTPAEVARIVNYQLRVAHIRDPQVTVLVKEAVGQRVTVGGEVKQPGQYPIVGRMSLLRAMALAQGTTEFSKLNDVVIFRTVSGQRLAALYDLNAIRHGAYADPELFAGDVVMVGDSQSRRLFKDVLQALPVLISPLVIALDRVTRKP
jgi:polysaccharide export outer membrane protein